MRVNPSTDFKKQHTFEKKCNSSHKVDFRIVLRFLDWDRPESDIGTKHFVV